jgi:hypothetical protein
MYVVQDIHESSRERVTEFVDTKSRVNSSVLDVGDPQCMQLETF